GSKAKGSRSKPPPTVTLAHEPSGLLLRRRARLACRRSRMDPIEATARAPAPIEARGITGLGSPRSRNTAAMAPAAANPRLATPSPKRPFPRAPGRRDPERP
ncbi:MAG: hypothetical protein ACYTFT_13740, partial [Planctomycetota bacterium]